MVFIYQLRWNSKIFQKANKASWTSKDALTCIDNIESDCDGQLEMQKKQEEGWKTLHWQWSKRLFPSLKKLSLRDKLENCFLCYIWYGKHRDIGEICSIFTFFFIPRIKKKSNFEFWKSHNKEKPSTVIPGREKGLIHSILIKWSCCWT